jgi:hypothetical protein
MRLPLLVAAVLLLPAPLGAQERAWTVGYRHFLLWSGAGTYTGDVPGNGAFVGYRFRPRWYVQAGFDHLSYDLEEPVEATDVREGDPTPVDLFTHVYRPRADLVLHFRNGRRIEPWLSAGVAYHRVEASEREGINADGGAYRLRLDSDGAAAVNAMAGFDVRIRSRYGLGLAAAWGRSSKGYTVTDEVTGSSGEIGALAPWGVLAQATVRF